MKSKSKLLFDEAPLVIQPKLACAVGLYEAIFLQLIHYWLQKSDKQYDDRVWTYNSYDGWQAQLPFLSERTVQRTIKNLEESKIIVVGNYNKSRMDKTKWYSINYEVLDEELNKYEKTYSRTCQFGIIDSQKRGIEHANLASSGGQRKGKKSLNVDIGNGKESRYCQSGTIDDTKTCIDDAKLAPSNMPDWHDPLCQSGTMQHAKLAPPIPKTYTKTILRQTDSLSEAEAPDDAKAMIDEFFKEQFEGEKTESKVDYFFGLLNDHMNQLSPSVVESYGRRLIAIAEKVRKSREPFMIDKRKVEPWQILQQLDWLAGNEDALLRAYQVIDKKSEAVKNRVGYAVSVLYNTAVEAVIFQNGGEEGWIG